MAEPMPPVWGTPDAPRPPSSYAPPPVQDRPHERLQDRPQDRPQEREIQWQHNPRGIAPRIMDPDVIHRQAGVSLLVNLVVLFAAFGLCSLPGAALALRARGLAHVDPVRAQRSLKWSWLLLASNLLLYLLLIVLAGIVVLSIFAR